MSCGSSLRVIYVTFYQKVLNFFVLIDSDCQYFQMYFVLKIYIDQIL